MSYRLRVSSVGKVELEVTSVPTEVEKKEIDKLIAPEGFIMAQTLKKLRALGSYATATVAPVTTTTVEQPKPKYDECPQCKRNTLAERITKQGKNKGRRFKSCFHEDKSTGQKCGYFEWIDKE